MEKRKMYLNSGNRRGKRAYFSSGQFFVTQQMYCSCTWSNLSYRVTKPSIPTANRWCSL